jgi:hypothetical protein
MAFKTKRQLPAKHRNGWRPYDAKGRLLRLRSGIVVVPFKQQTGSWDAVVVQGSKMYPRGGYNIVVFDQDLLIAEELQIESEGPDIRRRLPESTT